MREERVDGLAHMLRYMNKDIKLSYDKVIDNFVKCSRRLLR